jgi:MSHA pilin protein MshD
MTSQPEQPSLTGQSGVTLVELVVTIVVLSLALSGVFLGIQYTARHSADPMIEHQAAAIADAYLEEIMLRDYDDPDGSEAGEVRSTFDDVDDYNGLVNSGARDQLNNPINGLGQYSVSVDVNATAFGPAGDTVQAKEVTVTVTHPAGVSFEVIGYRTQY